MAMARAGARGPSATLGLLAFLALFAAVQPAAGQGFAIVGATVFDGTGKAGLRDAVLVVEKGKIRSVGPRALVPLPKGVPYLDGRGRFVVPGRVRESEVVAAVRGRVGGGATFEGALSEALRSGHEGAPRGTTEPGQPADLLLLEKDPRSSLDNLGSLLRCFVAGREVPVAR
jgi:imidazolonepropionase-like amidohydrolase